MCVYCRCLILPCIVVIHIVTQLSRLCDSQCGQLRRTRMPRRFEEAVGAVIRIVALTMLHLWKANIVVHVNISRYSATGVFAWSSWKVEIKNVSVGRVIFGSLFFKKRLHARHDVNGHKVGDGMLPRTSVSYRFSSWSVPQQFPTTVSRRCFVHLFGPHAKTSFQFFSTSVRC